MAKGNALTGSTHYLAEGDPVPTDMNPEVRFVGPGAPAVPPPDLPLTRRQVEALIDEKWTDITAEVAPEVVPDPIPAPLTPTPDPDSTQPPSSPESSDPGDYAAQTILALRDLCRQRGLQVAGAKADLVIRLNADDADLAAVSP